jgi:hypothetical protein
LSRDTAVPGKIRGAGIEILWKRSAKADFFMIILN